MLSAITMLTAAVIFSSLVALRTMVSNIAPFCFSDLYVLLYSNNYCAIYCDKSISPHAVTEPCGILPYIALGVTEGVDTLSVPAFDDGVSEPIDVAFPIGYSIEPLVQVCKCIITTNNLYKYVAIGGNKRILYI